jgi:hypothetical protein
MQKLLLALLLLGCGERTEIVVGVATDLQARGQIDLVSFVASRSGTPVVSHSWDLSDKPAGHYELPGSFGLYSPDGSEVGIELSVKAFRAGLQVTERDALLHLVQGKTLFTRMGVVADCGLLSQPTCAANETCVEGLCRPKEILAARLPSYRPELVDHIACDSGTQFAVSSTGMAMPLLSPGATCAADEFCQEGTCYKLLANEDGALQQGLWTDVSSTTTLALRAVWGTPDGADVFAVGDRGIILHLAGGLPMAASGFVPETSGTNENLYAVYGTSASDVWAAGADGTLLHRDASGWKTATSPTVARLDGLFALAPDDAWAVGRIDTTTPIALHLVGTTWDKVTLPPIDDLRAVWGTGPADVWAVGHHGNVVHWDSSGFTAATAPMGDYEGVGGAGSDVYLVGLGGLIVHNMKTESSGVSSDLFHVFASATGADVFAVGDLGVILHRENGAWVRQPAHTLQPLFGVWGSAPGDLFSVGHDGTLLHNTGVAAGCATNADCPNACANGSLTPRSCVQGACSDGTAAPCADNYACADATSCRTTCATDMDCQDGFYCAPNGDCRARRVQGSYCDDASDCKVGGCRVCAAGFFCTDHVCCDTSPANCAGASNGCMQCTAPSGKCGPAPYGTTSAMCEVMAGGCVQPVCNGEGSCGNNGDACGTTSCSGNNEVGSYCQDGTCTAASPFPCPSPFCALGAAIVGIMSCPFNTDGYCNNDSFCLNTEYCDGNHICRARKAIGQPCNPTSAAHCASEDPAPSNPPTPCNECASGQCVDGFCCNAACGGTCQACDLPGQLGTCSTVTGGAPHGARPPCRGSGTCTGLCDGKSATACSDSTAECAAAQCDPANNFTLDQPVECAAAACPSPAPTTSCAPFACAHGACLTRCAADADCASTTPTCDVKSGTCH